MAREDTEYTEADIIALKKAMRLGAQSVTTSDGKVVTFRGLNDMRALLQDMIRDVYGTTRRRGLRTQEVTTRVGGCD